MITARGRLRTYDRTMGALRSLVSRAWTWLAALHVLRQDALFYLCSAVFACGVLAQAISADYREWAAMALGPYLAAAAVCEVLVRLERRRAGTAPTGSEAGEGRPVHARARARAGMILGLLVLTVLLPLGFQLNWRANAHTGAQAQVEVAVIERAGDRAAAGHDPYLAHPRTVGVSPSSDARSIDADSYFPYLPGMVPFGMVNALSVPAPLADARLTMSLFTILVATVALLCSAAPADRRWRSFQVLVVLPTGALPLVTGGDDLPVLGLMLLGLVLAERRRPVASGVAMGLAGVLKFTAWGLVVLLGLGIVDRRGRPGRGRYGAAVAAVTVPVILFGVVLGPHAFVENVISFPLGLTSVHSPAASPLPGQELVSLFPHWKKAITALLVLVGGAVVVTGLLSRLPRTPAAAARFTGFVAVLAVVLAPATRFGYLIYPANLFVWSYLVAQPGDRPFMQLVPSRAEGKRPRSSEDQLASPTW